MSLKPAAWSYGGGLAPTFAFIDPYDSASQEVSRPAAAPERAAGLRGRRILIIEDNVDAATSLQDYLELMGHEVLVAFTGPEGVTRAGDFAPEVVLCDVGLPGMSGWDVARALGEAAEAGVHLVAITGYGSEEDRRRSSEAGFEVHLTKPLDLDALDQLLARLA